MKSALKRDTTTNPTSSNCATLRLTRCGVAHLPEIVDKHSHRRNVVAGIQIQIRGHNCSVGIKNKLKPVVLACNIKYYRLYYTVSIYYMRHLR